MMMTLEEISKELDILCKIYDGYHFETWYGGSSMNADFLLRQKVSTVYTMRWFKEHCDMDENFADLIGYSKEMIQEETCGDAIWDVAETNRQMEGAVLSKSSFRAYAYDLHSVFELFEMVEEEINENADEDQETLDMSVALSQYFDYGILETHYDIYEDMLESLYHSRDDISVDSLLIYESEKIGQFKERFETCKANLTIREREIVEKLFDSLFGSKGAHGLYGVYFSNLPFCGVKDGKFIFSSLLYVSSVSDDEIDYHNVVPEGYIRLYLLNELVDVLQEKYPQYFLKKVGAA